MARLDEPMTLNSLMFQTMYISIYIYKYLFCVFIACEISHNRFDKNNCEI